MKTKKSGRGICFEEFVGEKRKQGVKGFEVSICVRGEQIKG